MPPLVLTPPPAKRVVRRRLRLDPNPHFKPDHSHQLDVVDGCPDLQVPKNHTAREVQRQLARLDLRSAENKYSSLGRHGYRPLHVLGVLVYASRIGLHQSTEIARALKTDAAFRLLSGGWAISHQTLRRFRTENKELLLKALEMTVRLAHEDALLDLNGLAVDSVRVHANASRQAVRTLERSKKRLAELEALDPTSLTAAEAARREAKLEKHRDAIQRCQAAARSNVVVTNEAAGLLKFPDGSSGPGHRVTVTASGTKHRVVVGVLIDASGNDYGKLEPALVEARRVLLQAGVPETTVLRGTADAGYCSFDDLRFALGTDWADILVASKTAANAATTAGMFGHDRFGRDAEGRLVCPAGERMSGPSKDRTKEGAEVWYGTACRSCPLHDQCTKAARRKVTISPDLELARGKMLARLEAAGGHERYSRRIATVEPVFSTIESTMKYRRVSSRKAKSVQAEILLTLLAYNISRLAAARRLRCVLVAIPVF